MRLRQGYVFRPITVWPGIKTADRGRKRSPFGRAPYEQTLTLLEHELAMLAAKDVVIQLYLHESHIRLDGFPRTDARPIDPGVIVSFRSKYGPLLYPCDKFTHWRANLRAIAVSLESLRRVDRYGVTRRGEQYTGWKALRGSAVGSVVDVTDAARAVAEHSGIKHDGSLPDAVVLEVDTARTAIRHALHRTHPDLNAGDRSKYDVVDEARKVLTAHHAVSL